MKAETRRAIATVIIILLIHLPVAALYWIEPFVFTWDFEIFTFLLLTKATGLIGIMLFSINLLLSSRSKLHDWIFGGVDSMYLIHKRIGKVTLLILMLHATLATYRPLRVSQDAFLQFMTDTTYMTGRLSLIMLLGIVLITIYWSMKYEKLKFIHNFLTLALALGGLHALTVPSNVNSNLPLRIYILFFVISGILLYLYRKVIDFMDWHGEKYSISAMNQLTAGVTEIKLKPQSSGIAYKRGQFGFVKSSGKDWGHDREVHPFSFTSVPELDGEEISFAIKSSGDFTGSLDQLNAGSKDLFIVEGGYGGFQVVDDKPVVLIAGGIGITPFIGNLRHLTNTGLKAPISLFYSYRGGEAPFLDLLHSFASEQELLTFRFYNTEQGERIDINQDIQVDGVDPETQYYICGPEALVNDTHRILLARGVSRSHIHYERFRLF